MRKFYQVYADDLRTVLNFTDLFNRLRDLGSSQAVTITSKQMRLLLDDGTRGK